MILKTLFLAVAGVAVWKLVTAPRNTQSALQSDRKPHSENRWEGEGGALPQSGPQLGPEPTVVSQTA